MNTYTPININVENNISTDGMNFFIQSFRSHNEKVIGEQTNARDNHHQIIGGLTGYIGWDWLYVSILWVNENYRGHKLGNRLLQKTEREALDFGVTKAFLGTTEFQAREFYEKNGYEIFSVQEDLPPGYKNFEMKKYLK